MKDKKSVTSFLSGVFVTLMLISLVISAGATDDTIYKAITVRPGIKIYVDDVQLIPRDVTGAEVDVFIYYGTTYVPARALSEALGKAVEYDGETSSVYIGKRANKTRNLLTVCPPYQTDHFNAPATISMAGVKYANGFYLGSQISSTRGTAYFNLNGEYNTLSFDIGHIDLGVTGNSTCHIFLDGELAYSIELDTEMMPRHYDLDLHGALQMKIATTSDGGYYGFGNVEIS